MPAEAAQSRAFLAAAGPFETLPDDALDDLAGVVRTRNVAARERVLEPGMPGDCLYVVRRGVVELHDGDGEFVARLGEGEVFGQEGLLDGQPAACTATALEASTLLAVPAARVRALCDAHAAFRRLLEPGGVQRLREAMRRQSETAATDTTLMTTRLADLVRRAPITVTADTSIRDAAAVMTDSNVSSLLVVEQERLCGIVTDRDLRGRVVARGIATDGPVRDVMTPGPATIDATSYAYEALLEMAHRGFHHLPVMDGERVRGMITDTDLLKRQSASPFYILGEVHGCQTPEALVRAARGLSTLTVALVQANASARSVGHVVSSVGAAINTRLLKLAEQRFGPPPVPYAWLAGGSLARHEQSARSDQDNCLLIADDYDPERHGEYFEQFARFVCDGLNACGYVYCPGDVMAMTPRWRQPFSAWLRYFDEWIGTPEPKALMHASIFFDLRCVGGDVALFRRLQSYVVEKAKSNRMFHAHMAANALHHQPPLGLFRNFVLVKDGEHDRTLDLKHRGVAPITNVARVYALAGGVLPVNTVERVDAAADLGLLSAEGRADLRDAFEFISVVRLRHQVRQIQDGQQPDNYLSPAELSPFERNHLKDAFSVVRTIQSVLAQRYQTGLLG